MEDDEINKKLKNGELLFCPECDLYEDGYCEIIICSNPFMGCSDLDILAYKKRVVEK